MISKLSVKHQKEIALSFISLFFIAGLGSLKAATFSNRHFSIVSGLNKKNIPLVNGSEIRNRPAGYSLNNGRSLPGFKDQPNMTGQMPLLQTLNENTKSADLKAVQSILNTGPGQPEMSAFKSVGSDNMVSSFTGDFSYNIPLLDVGGYPVNIFYNSGISMDQEASWVGLGWNINPGTITRNMRGLPDDFDGTDIITKRQAIKDDKTWGVSGGAGLKFAGFPMGALNVSAGLSFNNKLGIALEAGIHPSLSISSKGADSKTSGLSYGASIGANLNLNSRSGASLTPSISFQTTQHNGTSGNNTSTLGAGYTYSSRMGITGMHLDAGVSKSKTETKQHTDECGNVTEEVVKKTSGSMGALTSSLSFVYPTVAPSIKSIFTRKSYNLSFSMGGEAFGLNGHVRIAGYYTESGIRDDDRITQHPAFGILHYQDGNHNTNAMLDFNRANDGVYTPTSPAIALPIYTYDIFSINGEGTGGAFRAYRGDLGFARDANVKTKDDAGSLGLDLGFGNAIHGGVEMSYAYTPTESGPWNVNNTATDHFMFQKSKADYQAVYFKNPGEKTVPDAAFQNAIGDDKLARLKMINIASGTPMLTPKLVKYDVNKNKIGEQALDINSVIKAKRDKRTQVISFLTAEEAERVGFDKNIYTYKAEGADAVKVYFSSNCDRTGMDLTYRYSADPQKNLPAAEQYRKANHISEINVLGTDGRKYIYGIPVYNTKQIDASFSIENGTTVTGKSTYFSDIDDVVEGNMDGVDGNRLGRDNFVEQQEMPAYTHSFLLTALLSPNYVDVSGNGISEDDMGDAIKFNYSKFNKGYKWRTPVGKLYDPISQQVLNTASYSKALKTDTKDDKAHYVYGEREMYHLYSIESKNMVARFFIKNDREDCKQVKGQNDASIDPVWGMQRLDKICLYSKADLMKNPDNAKPVKTVKFFQSYKLCKNNGGSNNSIQGSGKLTLDSIWFIYNSNEKKRKSKYVFYYPSDRNPDYNYNHNDRWGNYKPLTEAVNDNNNPGTLDNSDYSYSVQDKDKANKYAAAWTMNKILLPSGGVINVDYESDDYAYVQDKRAAEMCQILGFGNTATPTISQRTNNQLYSGITNENDYVYIKLPHAVTGLNNTEKRKDLIARYFANDRQLYMKLSVTMPSTPGSPGAEMIPVYAEIEDNQFGLITDDIAYVKVRRVQNGSTPMVQQALQFLKQQLPGKAYPGYDVSEESGGKAIVMALAGIASSFSSLTMGDENMLKSNLRCRDVETQNSFVRLSSPLFKKYGGGVRVKKVIINDNWNKMTLQYDATYGQEYIYTTTELVNGQQTQISSGVASWEPSVGGDENPHKEVMRYMNHNKGGPYDFGAIELPLGEVFYPTPSVGYSRVQVLSIHRDTVKNLPTRQVTEFYTTRDFPFKSMCTQLNDGEANVPYSPPKILQLLRLDMKKAITQSQGFLVDMNDMNGKVKLQETYSAQDIIRPVSSTQYYYNIKKASDKTYNFDHEFATINKPDGKVTTSLIGRDIELMADFREHKSETITTNININFDFFFLGIFPIPLTNLLQPTIYEGTTYRSASLLKIVNHYGMLDSVVSIDKGSMVSTKNLVYDAETGNPLLTRTNNEHNKPVYNFSYPAHWAYSGMGPAYQNIDVVYEGVTFRNGKLESAEVNTQLFESGDELYVISQADQGPLARFPCDPPRTYNVGPYTFQFYLPLPKNHANRIWALFTGKVGSLTPEMVFIDKEGNPYTAKDVSLRIIRSGHRNMLDQTVGNITSVKNPIDQNGNLIFNDATNIVQTSAATFKDHWRVDNSFYRFRETVRTDVPLSVNVQTFLPTSTLSLTDNHCDHDPNYQHILVPYLDPNYFNTQYMSHGRKKKNVYTMHYMQSWAMYDFSSIPSDANIVSAKLSLKAHSLPVFPSTSVHSQYLPCNVHFSHNEYNPHIDFNRNTFFISRAKRSWNVGTDWRDFFYNQSYIDFSNAIIKGPTQTPYKSYICNVDSDDRSDITSMVSRMIQENRNPSLGYPTGIKLSLKSNISEDFKDWEKNVASPTVCFERPSVSVYYYSCSELNRSQGDSTSNAAIICNLNFPQQYCTSYETLSYCKSKFSKKYINPYVEGVWGNWRIDSTYAYYGNRKESDPVIPVDTRTAGTIINFEKFWNFSNVNSKYLTRNFDANNVWVWNSTITQYNRKGYEIENKDPLGRFNAGLYGYNQQLPTAVANNSRVREVMFDGFEDYNYETATNCIDCKPGRHAAIENIHESIVSDQSHTGAYSLKVLPGAALKLKAPVTNTEEADRSFSLRIKMDSTTQGNSTLTTNANGMGLWARYYYHPNQTAPFEPGSPGSNVVYTTTQYPSIPYSETTSGNGTVADNFSVKWEGILQAPVTGTYQFLGLANNGFKIKINGVQVTHNYYWANSNQFNAGYTNTQFNWTIGETVPIEICFYSRSAAQQFVLRCKINGVMTNFPASGFYIPGTTTFNTPLQNWCTKLDEIQVKDNALTDTFSLLREKKMLLSAWVKENTTECKCSSYVRNNINISYTGASETVSMQPTGNIIEGWQRYEGIFIVPPTATAIEVSLNNTSSGGQAVPVYFDDVRIHPFNSNVKSFVYHPSNLRLTSELDENNYASFYEYDNDGTLTRVKKETTEGIKTITETRSATQKKVPVE